MEKDSFFSSTNSTTEVKPAILRPPSSTTPIPATISSSSSQDDESKEPTKEEVLNFNRVLSVDVVAESLKTILKERLNENIDEMSEEKMRQCLKDTRDLCISSIEKSLKAIDELRTDRTDVIASAKHQAREYVRKTKSEKLQLEHRIKLLSKQLDAACNDKESIYKMVEQMMKEKTELASDLQSARKELEGAVSRHTAAMSVAHRLAKRLDPMEAALAIYENIASDSFACPAKEGWLTKQGSQRKNWKRRWHVLVDNFLFYYKTQKEPTPLGVLHLSGHTIEDASVECKRPHTLKLRTPERLYFVSADDGKEEEAWRTVLKEPRRWGTRLA
mmetsp:Transcript_44922/g.113190  ORF Transcript_44922/g.113190 Transcript_44922/m.113190 type:complete len:331 (-) Transcript_44922:73-1065(-)